jgi:hypothetical protein
MQQKLNMALINQNHSLHIKLKSAKNPPMYEDDPPRRQEKGGT